MKSLATFQITARAAARWMNWALLIALLVSAGPAHAAPAAVRITGDEAAAREYFSAWERLRQLRTYRVRMASGGQNMVTDHVNPNRQRIIIGSGNDRQEILLVGNEMRVRSGTGPYMCLPPQARPQIGGPNPDPQSAQGEINVTRLPDASIEGAAVRGYLIATTSEGRAMRMRGWVLTSGELRRIEFLNAAGSVESTMDYYDFNAPITIPDPPPCS